MSRGSAHSWHWYAARIAVALIVPAMLGLLWLLHRQELEENRTALIRDVLWVEQNFQFTVDRNVEALRQLGEAAPADAERLERRVAQLRSASPGLVEVLLLDPEGRLAASAPAPGSGRLVAGEDAAFRLARSTGKPTWAAPRLVGGEHQTEVFVPRYRGGAFAGAVVGVYGLRALLTGLVPWWLAEKHRVTIRDADGDVLAARSNVAAEDHPVLTHQVVLDPPGHGLLLHVTSYGAETTLPRNALALVIITLAATVLGTMWSLRRHIQRRLETEQQLREEHAFRKSMEDSLETGLRAFDLEGRIVYVNPAFCRMVGFTEQELIGHGPPQPYWPPEEADRIEAAFRAARGAGRVGVEYEFVRKDGRRFDALVYEAPLVDASGRQTGWMGSVLDITDRKRARERARQQEEKLAATARLVTVGELASAIAHELNQPLSAIASYTTGCLNLLATGAGEPGQLADALEKTARQAQRAGGIIRRVHQFVRKSEPVRTRVQLRVVLDEAVGFAQAEARKRGVRIRSEGDGEVELLADPVLLQQVMLNLLRNGMDAMAQTPADAREITVTTERVDGAVTVKVADRGCGIPPAVRAQLFEPFFSTKPEGMGMGLNICRSILEIHRGRVWAEPNPDGGSVFAFTLPLEAP